MAGRGHLKENRAAIGRARRRPSSRRARWRIKLSPKSSLPGVDDDLVCVKGSLIFRDAPFLMANAGAVLATRFGVIAVAVKDWGIHEHELIPEAPSMGKSVSRRNCAPLQSGQLYPSSHR